LLGAHPLAPRDLNSRTSSSRATRVALCRLSFPPSIIQPQYHTHLPPRLAPSPNTHSPLPPWSHPAIPLRESQTPAASSWLSSAIPASPPSLICAPITPTSSRLVNVHVVPPSPVPPPHHHQAPPPFHSPCHPVVGSQTPALAHGCPLLASAAAACLFGGGSPQHNRLQGGGRGAAWVLLEPCCRAALLAT
jgi:hypothetical protein